MIGIWASVVLVIGTVDIWSFVLLFPCKSALYSDGVDTSS